MNQKLCKNKTVYFRKWQNKKFAVFNSLHRVIKICTLSLSYTLVVAPVQAKGENDSIIIHYPEYDLEEVTVAGSRSPLLEEELARIINIVPAADIESSPSPRNSNCCAGPILPLTANDRSTTGLPLMRNGDKNSKSPAAKQCVSAISICPLTDASPENNATEPVAATENWPRLPNVKLAGSNSEPATTCTMPGTMSQSITPCTEIAAKLSAPAD